MYTEHSFLSMVMKWIPGHMHVSVALNPCLPLLVTTVHFLFFPFGSFPLPIHLVLLIFPSECLTSPYPTTACPDTMQALYPLFLPGEFHGQRSLEGYSPWSCKRVGHDLVTKQQHIYICVCIYIYMYTLTYVYVYACIH